MGKLSTLSPKILLLSTNIGVLRSLVSNMTNVHMHASDSNYDRMQENALILASYDEKWFIECKKYLRYIWGSKTVVEPSLEDFKVIGFRKEGSLKGIPVSRTHRVKNIQ